MNETIKTLLSRRSVRSYEDKAVPKELVDAIIQCGKYACNGGGGQPWHFTVVTNRQWMDAVSALNKEIYLNSPVERLRIKAQNPEYSDFYKAPMAIIISGNSPRSLADCACATQNMAVAAASLGLGSCFIASFKSCLESEEGKKLFSQLPLPEGYAPQFALALGYPKGDAPVAAPRKENIVAEF
ncbi:MAG: nitroreductase [Oscillospiraceae bacterium]|nr:nitroreductase [Oscillospiraceae bacterium]